MLGVKGMWLSNKSWSRVGTVLWAPDMYRRFLLVLSVTAALGHRRTWKWPRTLRVEAEEPLRGRLSLRFPQLQGLFVLAKGRYTPKPFLYFFLSLNIDCFQWIDKKPYWKLYFPSSYNTILCLQSYSKSVIPRTQKYYQIYNNNSSLYISMFSLKVKELARDKYNASFMHKNFLK